MQASAPTGPPRTLHAPAPAPADNGSAFLVHAIVCATVYILSCLTAQLQFYGAAFLMWELSTPFMYARWLLLKAGWGESKLLAAVNVAFMAVFFGCRNVWGPSESPCLLSAAHMRLTLWTSE